jgi:hypothetical protein
MQTTETMKHQKNHLKEEGYDITKVGNDPLYFLLPHEGYVPLTADMVNKIESGEIRF